MAGPELIIFPVLIAAQRVISGLNDLKAKKKHNSHLAVEIDEFVTSLNKNIDVLKEDLPERDGSWAVESLTKDLDEAANFLETGLRNGDFERFWDARKITDSLEKLKQDIINKFQVKLFITTLEVVIKADEKIDDFGSRMLELASLSAARSHAATDEIRKLLQPLVVGLRRQDQRIQSFVSMVRGNEVKVETSTDTQKFLEDVLANLESLTDEESSNRRPPPEDDRDNYLDPNTKELMVDPVKCKDGRTYDRFTVFHYNLTQRTPLIIACDDMDVRGRLFEKFVDEGVENKFYSLRKSYRDEALSLCWKGQSAEALAMIKNVLEWAPNDKECIEIRGQLEYQMGQYRPSAPEIQHMKPTYTNNAQYKSSQPYSQPSNQQQSPPQNSENLAVSIIVMVLCFPFSLCCIPCLFPNACGP